VTAAPIQVPFADGLTVEPERSRAWLLLRRNPSFWIGAIAVALIVGVAVLAPLVAPYDPNFQFRGEGLTPGGDPLGPTAKFPLGTDKLGRDELSRLVYGARTSLTVGIVANVLATLIGVVVGTLGAFFRGYRVRFAAFGRTASVPIPLETLLMRLTDAVLAFPALLVAIALVAIVGPSLGLVTVVIAAVLWTGTARVIYGRALVVLASDFVVAATAIGVTAPQMVLRHLLPHLVPLIIV
jgi:peptide/nickel transport system permease protein